MTRDDLRPRWLREIERLATGKTQIILSGNIKDTVLYPISGCEGQWTLGSLRDALFSAFRSMNGGYDLIAAYNLIDGLVFADDGESKAMGNLYEELVKAGRAKERSADRAPGPLRTDDPLDHVLQSMRNCLQNRERPCVFIVEYASQLVRGPSNLQLPERVSFLRLVKAAQESQIVSVEENGQRKAVQNLLVMTCDRLTDLPAWLYLNNPFVGSVEIEPPRSYERRHYFDLFMPPSKGGLRDIDVDELVDLTDDMSIRDLSGIRALARRWDSSDMKTKALVDCYKYGVKESEWDSLDWSRLANAEGELSKRVLGQEAAIAAVSDVLRRAALDLSGAQHSSRTKPRGVLFFAGPTGVGKTELAKSIAELVFSTEEACVRFDMSEYSQSHSDQRLLGAPPGYVGYEEGGQLTNRVKANPFCVLLFDEIEKAHPTILDKFLQILEDGRMTDGRGDTVYFSESIIIFTSNVGIYKLDPGTARPMVNPVDGMPVLNVDPAKHTSYPEVRQKVLGGVQSYFKHFLGRPELLNRIGQNIVVFDFIRRETLQKILEQKVLKSIQSQVQERWKLRLEFSDEVVQELMEYGGSDVASGGRGMGNLAELAVLNPVSRVLFGLLREKGQDAISGRTLRVEHVGSAGELGGSRYEIRWTLD